MWKIIKQLLLITLSLLFWENANAQGVRAFSSFNKDSIMIGDRISMEITVEAPADYHIFWPIIGDTLTGKIQVLEQSAIDSTAKENRKTFYQEVSITSYDSGYHAIPPVEILYRLPDDTVMRTTETEPHLLFVNEPKVDLSQDIKDIKAPLEAPISFKEIAPYIGGGLALILIIFLIWYLAKKRKTPDEPVFIKPKPKEPAHRTALNKLEELRNKKLWQSGKIKQYHTELTDILRHYIEDQFDVPAVEMTSDEIVQAFRKRLEKETLVMLSDTLKTADLVKFAKFNPLPEEHERGLKNAYEFVRNTMPASQPIYREENHEKSFGGTHIDNGTKG